MRIAHRGTECRLQTGIPISLSLLPTLRCVIFDLDGVLTDTAELISRRGAAWRRSSASRSIAR